MATYTYAQLEQLWIQNGGSKSLAPVAAAIAEAESGGNAAATNPTDNNGTQTSWGLWQISNGTHGQPVPNILDPNVNAGQAVGKYAASGWQPWGTYTSGAYRKYLNGSTTPDTNVPAGGAAGTQAAASSSDCLIGPFPHTSWCILNKGQGRALIGGSCMVAGALVAVVGLALVAVFALNRSGIGKTIVDMTPAGKLAGKLS
jgi:hypothetical protein